VRVLSRSLRVRIRVGILLGIAAVWVGHVLVASRVVCVSVWVWLLLLDGGRVGWSGDWWAVAGREWISATQIVRGTLLMGYGGMIR